MTLTEEHEDSKERMYNVYQYVLSRLQEYLPDFKVANAVIHFDEASPHMHVVGVPVWSGTSKGEVAPVFRDDSGGYNYKLERFQNIETKAIYRVESLKGEICSDNRVGKLEQLVEHIEIAETQTRLINKDYKR